MQNLKTETLEALNNHGKTIADIEFITTGSSEIPVHAFFDQVSFNYDDGYGGQIITAGLAIVGSDWWLERGEYDGAEWWEFKQKPTKPTSILNYNIEQAIKYTSIW